MNKKTLAASAALCMLALGFAPTSSADPCAWDEVSTDVDNTADPKITCAKKTAVGPAGVSTKQSALGIGFCLIDGAPLPCISGGGGGVFFDLSSYNGKIENGLNARVWAEHIGPIGQVDPNLEGFRMTVCSDRNDNNICTPNNDPLVPVDDYVTSFATSDDDAAKPDGKASGTIDAEVSLCVTRDLAEAGGDFDDLVVFIGAYTDGGNLLGEPPVLPDPTNTGASVGNFDIYLDTSGGVVENC